MFNKVLVMVYYKCHNCKKLVNEIGKCPKCKWHYCQNCIESDGVYQNKKGCFNFDYDFGFYSLLSTLKTFI